MAEEDTAQEEAQKLYAKRLQQLQLEMQKKEILRSMLEPEAYERMMNVRMSNPELYEKVVGSLAYIARSGKQMEKITDEQLKGLLLKMTDRYEPSIEFRKK